MGDDYFGFSNFTGTKSPPPHSTPLLPPKQQVSRFVNPNSLRHNSLEKDRTKWKWWRWGRRLFFRLGLRLMGTLKITYSLRVWYHVVVVVRYQLTQPKHCLRLAGTINYAHPVLLAGTVLSASVQLILSLNKHLTQDTSKLMRSSSSLLSFTRLRQRNQRFNLTGN